MLTIAFTGSSLYVLLNVAFGLGFYIGLSFLIASTLAIVRGHIFTHPLRIFLVAIAVVIGTLVIPGLGRDAWEALRGGDTIAAAALAGLVVLLWLLKRQLETGRMKSVGIRASRRRRRSRRK